MATTYTGRLVTPGNFGVPAPLDLAVQRGRMPRFNGGTVHWWSVLHHVATLYRLSVMGQQLPSAGVSQAVGQWYGAILLHDGEEAMSYDIMSTWKCDEQRALEKKLEQRLYDTYIGPKLLDIYGAELKALDRLALVAEAIVLGPPNVVVHSGLLDIMMRPTDEQLAAVEGILHLYYGAGSSTEEDSPLVQWFLGEWARNSAIRSRGRS